MLDQLNLLYMMLYPVCDVYNSKNKTCKYKLT